MEARVESRRRAPVAPSEFSNHSFSLWVSPDRPPPPMDMAGIRRDIGTLASVEETAYSGSLPRARVASSTTRTRGCEMGSSPAGRSPMSSISRPSDPSPRASSIAMAALASSITRDSTLESASELSERRSSSTLPSTGIALMLVPPLNRATVRVVRGSSGSSICESRWMNSPMAAAGLDRPQSVQECPPAPRTTNLKRRLARA